MKVNTYKDYITQLSKCRTETYLRLRRDWIEKRPEATDAIDVLSTEISPDTKERASNWLSVGCFDRIGMSTDQKLCAICLSLEAEYERELGDVTRQCTEYTGDEPIFEDRELNNLRKDDLVDIRGLQRLPNTNIILVGKKWAYIDSRIPLQFHEWLERCFKDCVSSVRVSPDRLYDMRPPQMVVECVITPGQYRWWNKLGRYIGDENGSMYELLGTDVNNYSDYYDYNALHVRRLETIAKRKKAEYFSMMIEELSEYHNPLDPSRHYVVGRMIHLDTEAPLGATIEDAVLKHIDLAFNLYVDDNATLRMSQTLADGQKVTKAKPRTHVLRVDHVPFKTIFKFAESFFRSKTLVAEWLYAEFEEVR